MADFDPDAYLADSTSTPSQGQTSSAFDPDAYIASFDPDKYLSDKPAPEGIVAANVRSAAHGIIPALGAAAGGAALGTAIGGPVGTIAGGIIGGIAGGMAGDVAQDKLQDAIPALDDRAQQAANQEEYPISTKLSGMAPFAGNPGRLAGSLVSRAASGAMLGGIDAAQQAYQKGSVDPGSVLESAAFGAAFPHGNAATRAIDSKVSGAVSKFLPGRPGRVANPAAAQDHIDVGDNDTEVNVGESSLAQAAPTATGETTGNPQSAPERSERSYPKQRPLGMAEQNYVPTQGDMDPATSSALEAANPAPPEPAPQQQPEVQAPQPQPQAQPSMPAPSVEAGFPAPGEPAAMGANDATPMPAGLPEKAAAAIKQSTQMPEIKGRTPANDTISDAQKEAGNFLKARTKDFGKPIAIETHAGDIRRSKESEPAWQVKLPYDYGYFNNTVGPDGDHIDFIRPPKDAPEAGDKHFIVDQKNAETGKYDEPKVMTYIKDEATARDLYNRGFSDGKGPDRLHDITEVSRGDLVKYLAKHTKTPPKAPYGNPIPKTVKDRAVVQDAVAKLRAKGDEAGAAKLLSAPEEKLAAAIEGKRTRKYGVKGGYPVEGLTLDNGEPATANTKPKAMARTQAHKKVVDWFEESKPPSQMDLSKETNGELLDRVKGAGRVYPQDGEWEPKYKPKEWLLAREARTLLRNPTPKAIDKFRDAERLLRGGDAAVQAYRGGNRVDADIAQSRRSGDEAVSNAENAQHIPGRNEVEDAAIAAIDAKRGGKFDVPHEEAETMVKPTPVKSKGDLLKNKKTETVDAADSSLARIDTGAISKAALRKAEAEKLAGRKSEFANAPSEDRAGTTKKPSINIGDKDEMQRLIDMSNQAMKKRSLSDEAIAAQDVTKAPKGTGDMRGEFNDAWNRFVENEAGSVDINKIKADLKKAMETTAPESYIARTPKKDEPNAAYTRSISDEFHRISQTDKNHRNQLSQDADKLMAALGKKVWSAGDLLGQLKGGKDQRAINKLYQSRIDEALKQIYRAREADSAHVDLPGKVAGKTNVESLPPRLKSIYDEYLAPVFQENDDFAKAVRAVAPDRIGPDVEHHIARITKGDTSEYNMLKDRDDPTGPQYNGLSVDASMAHERAFAVLERVADGKRVVIQNRGDGNGFTVWDKSLPKGFERIKDPNYKFEANQPYTITPKKGPPVDYIMRHAMSDEIMKNARDNKGKPMKYYQNAALSAFMTNAQMGSMMRHLTELHNITQTKQWNELTTRNTKTAAERGWEQSKLPNFKGTYMDPQLKYVLDDYAKPGFDSPELLRNLSQGVTKLMFWMPTAHIANVGAHWFVGRGFDNANVARLYRTGSQAIRSVMAQDSLQRDLQQSGAGLILGGVISRDFIGQTGRRFGEAMDANPSKWGPIADKMGVPLKKLSDWIYNNSSKVMWAANDMFLTQRILELEEKGLTRQQAINKAEKDIPNYRLPTTINGSGKVARIFQQAMADPTVLSFGRYHYGMFNSYANIVKEALSAHSSLGDRVEAAGKMVAMGVLAFVVYPALDKTWQLLTGNDKASANRRGPISVPSHIAAALQGKEDIMSAARSSLTVPPVWSTALETLSNKDWRGKPIMEPGDVSGDLKGKGRALVQGAEHVARGLVSPYATLSNALKKDIGPVAAIRDQALDIKDPSDKANQYDQKSDIINFRNANNRFKHGGAGPAEGLFNSLFGR